MEPDRGSLSRKIVACISSLKPRPRGLRTASPCVSGDQQLSYRQWNEQANQLAHHLRSLGVGPDALVGLCLDRSAG